MRVRLHGFIESDRHGYFLTLWLYKTNVTKLMELGVVPAWDADTKRFILKIALGNTCTILMNGLKLTSFADERFSKIPIEKLTIKEICLKRYKIPKFDMYCYARRVVIDISAKYLMTLGES